VETLHFVQSDMRDSFATTCQVGTTLNYGQCKPEKKNGQEKSFAALLAGMVDRDIISMVDTPNTRDKRRMAYLVSRLLKKCGNGPQRHTGRDEVEIRYPVRYCFLWIPDSRFATSGMTDLVFALKIPSFSAACQCLVFST
ncbi:MAG: hypothetical protein ACERKR_11720, partial [Deltaproteobacteria bacterium]